MLILWPCPIKISLYYADGFMCTESLCPTGVSAKVTLLIVPLLLFWLDAEDEVIVCFHYSDLLNYKICLFY